MKKDIVYITGHRHPDSDSIISAIAYALFKQRKGIRAIPCRLGELNAETKYLLNRFGFEEPMLFEDARATLDEIEMDEPLTISPTTTIYETLQMMNEQNKQSYGVVNQKGQLLGMVTKSDLATVGLGDTAVGIALLRETPIENICRTINGRMIYDDPKLHFNGKVSIIAMTETRLANYDVQDRLVVLGNDAKAQKTAITKGAGILIVVWSDSIDDEVLELAKLHHCPIIISGHGTMNTSRYLYFSPSVKLLMKRDVVSFNMDEFVEDVGKKMLKTRYRSYPVVDNDNHLKGYISRFHILDHHNKKVILVDHNEYSQSVKGIEAADLLEVVDHHRIGDVETTTPIRFRNEIIGSTCSIIAKMYQEAHIAPEKTTAAILCCAIISDTMNFNSPTTTPADKEIAKGLAELAEVDLDALAKEMFGAVATIKGRTMSEILYNDFKEYNIDGKRIAIGQINIADEQEIVEVREAFLEYMETINAINKFDLLMMCFTSADGSGSNLLFIGPLAGVVDEAFKEDIMDDLYFVDGVISRKKQIIPALSKQLGEL